MNFTSVCQAAEEAPIGKEQKKKKGREEKREVSRGVFFFVHRVRERQSKILGGV